MKTKNRFRRLQRCIRPVRMLATLGLIGAASLALGVQPAAAGGCFLGYCGTVVNYSDRHAEVTELFGLGAPGAVPCNVVNESGAAVPNMTCKPRILWSGQTAGGSRDQVGIADVDAVRFPVVGFYHNAEGSWRYVPHHSYLKISTSWTLHCQQEFGPAAAPRCYVFRWI